MQYSHYVSNFPSYSLLGTLGDVLGVYGKYIWVNDIPVNFDYANLFTVFYSSPSLNDTFRLFLVQNTNEALDQSLVRFFGLCFYFLLYLFYL